jgi:hypothetical protein
MKQDIWVTILPEYQYSLFEIPGFICDWEYDKGERRYPGKEQGKIVTQNFNFRFILQEVKIDTN